MTTAREIIEEIATGGTGASHWDRDHLEGKRPDEVLAAVVNGCPPNMAVFGSATGESLQLNWRPRTEEEMAR